MSLSLILIHGPDIRKMDFVGSKRVTFSSACWSTVKYFGCAPPKGRWCLVLLSFFFSIFRLDLLLILNWGMR